MATTVTSPAGVDSLPFTFQGELDPDGPSPRFELEPLSRPGQQFTEFVQPNESATIFRFTAPHCGDSCLVLDTKFVSELRFFVTESCTSPESTCLWGEYVDTDPGDVEFGRFARSMEAGETVFVAVQGVPNSAATPDFSFEVECEAVSATCIAASEVPGTNQVEEVSVFLEAGESVFVFVDGWSNTLTNPHSGQYGITVVGQ